MSRLAENPPPSSFRAREGRGGAPRREPDPANDRILEVCSFYARSPGRTLGRRTTWDCPACARPKFEALPERRLAGCWSSECEVPTTTNALGIVAFFEKLDPRRDFPEVLRRAYEILGLEAADPSRAGVWDAGRGRPPGQAPGQAPGQTPGRPPARPPAAHRPEKRRPPEAPPDPGLLDAVYGGILALCPLSERDLRYWEGRGVRRGTARRARFGSITPRRARAALAHLEGELGRAALLRVPGFFLNARGHLSFTLLGDYTLIPYHDRLGRVTTIEGRAMTARQAARTKKYLALRGSGAHLYVFPGVPFDGIRAFTEGTVGAIVAAQEGLAVASIKGVRCYRGPDGGPLPELENASFAGRTVPFVPDADDPPKKDVLDAAPKAARALALPHGGRPAIAYLPRGLDLDEWLLSLPVGERKPAFHALLAAARPLPTRRRARARHPPKP